MGGLIGPRQVLHRLVDAAEIPARDGQIAPVGCATGQDNRVEPLPQLGTGDINADIDAGLEPGALGPHLLQAPVDMTLLHLELGDAVAQQSADTVRSLVHGDVVAGAGQLLGGG